MISREQAAKAAYHISSGIDSVLSRGFTRKIVVVTHVPPFVQPLSDIELYSWYASRIMGDMLISVAQSNPNVEFEVFCGHVHKKFEGRITKNLLLRSGASSYSDPRPQGVFNI
jgi:hypothetical protein